MYLGIDIGGTNIAYGVVDEACRIIYKESMKTYAERSAAEILEDIADKCAAIVSQYDISKVGIGAPGGVDAENGILVGAANLPFRNTPAAKVLRDRLKLPVFINNDANCAALGELYAGAGKEGARSLFVVTLGTGIGGGMVIENKIYAGAFGCAGEIGHTCVDIHGDKCRCGRRGCWEMYASATALLRQTREAAMSHPESLLYQMRDNISGRTAFDAMRRGCAAAKDVVENYVFYLSVGILNIMKLIQPEVIVISGGLSNERDYILKPLAKHITGKTRVEVSSLGNEAGIIGAALLGRTEKV